MRPLFSASVCQVFAVVCLLCSACAPIVNRPGAALTTPRLARAYFVATDCAVLPVRSWLPSNGPAKAVVVALHGFNDYSYFFTTPGQFLSQQGIASYAYDQRGFGNAPGRGLWAGTQAYVDDLRTFIALLRRHYPDRPLYVLGESMGGAIAIVTMASPKPPDINGLILAAPAVRGREIMPWWQRATLDSVAYTLPWLRLTGKGLNIMASDNIEMLRAISRDPLVIKATRVDAMYGLVALMDAALSSAGKLDIPTLVLYGEKDQVVPRRPILRMLDKMPMPQTRPTFYANGYHLLLRDLQAEKPWHDIATWISQHNANFAAYKGAANEDNLKP